MEHVVDVRLGRECELVGHRTDLRYNLERPKVVAFELCGAALSKGVLPIFVELNQDIVAHLELDISLTLVGLGLHVFLGTVKVQL